MADGTSAISPLRMGHDTHLIADYLSQVKSAIDGVELAALETVAEELFRAYIRGSQIFVFGNGGSAATAAHFACDLGKGTVATGVPRFRVIALTDNVALLTAWANDVSYEDIFVEQLANLVRPRDVIIGLSGSGRSPNVVNGLRYARERGARTIALTGSDGGQVKHVADITVNVPAGNISQIEDVHLVILHALSAHLREKLARTATNRKRRRQAALVNPASLSPRTI